MTYEICSQLYRYENLRKYNIKYYSEDQDKSKGCVYV